MFDKVNKEKAQYERGIKLGLFMTLGAFVSFIPLSLAIGPLAFFIIVFPFFGGAIYANKNSQKIKEISVEFKKKYVEEELLKAIPESKYKPYDGFKENEVVYSNLLFESDRYYSEDLISGEIDGVSFRSSDVKQEEVRGSGKDRKVVTVFQGRFYEFDFHKPFKYELLVLQPMSFRPFSGFEKVKTESIDFNNELKIYSNNPLEAIYILTPDFMEKLRYFDNKYHDKIGYSFKNNKLFIAIDDRKDYFDIKAFKNVDDNLIASYKDEFDDMKAFVKVLNLNSTLFK